MKEVIQQLWLNDFRFMFLAITFDVLTYLWQHRSLVQQDSPNDLHAQTECLKARKGKYLFYRQTLNVEMIKCNMSLDWNFSEECKLVYVRGECATINHSIAAKRK